MNKKILQLAVPFIISNITVPLLGTADTALMGNFGSTAHLGAVGLGSAIFNFLYWNFAFIRMSVVGLTAQAYGAERNQEMARLLTRSLAISLAGAFLLLLLQWPIRELAILLSGREPAVAEITLKYYNIRIWAAPATIALSSITGWFVGMQNSRAPMLIAIGVNLVNLGLNFLFVLGLGMKSEGVALSTLIAQYLGLAFALIILSKKYKHVIKILSLKQVVESSGYQRFFRVNRDVFIRTFFVISVLTFYNFVSAHQDEALWGMNVIFLQLVYAFSFFVDGFANAAEALVGKYLGAHKPKKLVKSIKLLFIWGGGIAIVFTLVYLIAWPYILRVYTSDIEVIKIAKDYIIWIIAIPLISITAFIWDGVYLGATATAEQRNSTLIAACAFFLIFVGLKPIMGNHALLLAQLVFFGLRGLLQSMWYKKAILSLL